jgi:hypothetical protein
MRVPAGGLLLAFFVLFSPPLLAQDAPWYIGVSFGGTKYDLDESNRSIDADLILTGAATASTTTTRDDGDAGLKVSFGYNASRFLGLEISYVNLGEAVLQTITNTDLFIGPAEVHGWSANIVANLPLVAGLGLFAKAGPFAWQREVHMPSVTTGTTEIRGDFDGFDWTAGAGLTWLIVEGLALRIEAERFMVGDDYVDYYSSGLLFRF